MNVVLMAHEERRELLIRFCTAHKDVLRQHRLIVSKTLTKAVEKETGLTVDRTLDPVFGGYQQVSAYLSCGEVDLLIFFRDPNEADDGDESAMLSMCDRHRIPLATNIATADMLMYTVERKAIS